MNLIDLAVESLAEREREREFVRDLARELEAARAAYMARLRGAYRESPDAFAPFGSADVET